MVFLQLISSLSAQSFLLPLPLLPASTPSFRPVRTLLNQSHPLLWLLDDFFPLRWDFAVRRPGLWSAFNRLALLKGFSARFRNYAVFQSRVINPTIAGCGGLGYVYVQSHRVFPLRFTARKLAYSMLKHPTPSLPFFGALVSSSEPLGVFCPQTFELGDPCTCQPIPSPPTCWPRLTAMREYSPPDPPCRLNQSRARLPILHVAKAKSFFQTCGCLPLLNCGSAAREKHASSKTMPLVKPAPTSFPRTQTTWRFFFFFVPLRKPFQSPPMRAP